MRIIKYLVITIIILIVSLALLLLYLTITDYNPAECEIVFETKESEVFDSTKPISILTWNIGYCGLGSDMDFFYDGGKKMRTSKEKTCENLKKITEFLQSNDTVDFLCLQEIDIYSKRTYFINEADSIKNKLHKFQLFFAKNYDSKFVPEPLSSPMGRVVSGLTTFAKQQPEIAERYSFPGQASYPMHLFMLDRCFLVNRYNLANGKEFLLINTHNAAFEDSTIKIQHMNYFKKFLTKEYEKGNYIIVAGDWNQNPPNFNKNSFSKSLPEKNFKLISIEQKYLPIGWQWVYDKSVPTNRYLDKPYNKNTTAKVLIDYFLISPNVETISINSLDLNFENSDHNPVLATMKLK